MGSVDAIRRIPEETGKRKARSAQNQSQHRRRLAGGTSSGVVEAGVAGRRVR